MNIVAIGDNVADCYIDQNKYYPGGNAVNVAVNCKRSGAKKVSYIGVFATDDKATHIKYALDEEGIDYSLSREVKGVSGQPKVNLTTEGDRVFVSSPQNTVQHKVKLRLTEEDMTYLRSYQLCHTSCYSHLEDELSTLSKILKVSFDFSENYNPKYLEKVCPYISYAFFSGANLTKGEIDSLIENLSQYNLEVIGITRGDKPAIFIKDVKIYHQNVLNVDIVDTMGAGDSFIGGFLTEYYTSNNMERSLQFAAKQASKTCGFFGGFGYGNELV